MEADGGLGEPVTITVLLCKVIKVVIPPKCLNIYGLRLRYGEMAARTRKLKLKSTAAADPE